MNMTSVSKPLYRSDDTATTSFEEVTFRVRFKRQPTIPAQMQQTWLFRYIHCKLQTSENKKDRNSMSGSSDPFAWLGLLQWSLKYSDGTHPSSDDNVTPMSAEDKAFLEMVMKEGIINENERMKTILYQVTQQIEIWKTQSVSTDFTAATKLDDDASVDTVYDLLQELRDIVEQIDFARAFMSMKGITFLLGCIENKENIYLPMNIRQLSCAIIATLCQHNPPVQKECIELGAIKILYQLLDQFTNKYDNTDEDDEHRKSDALFCERIIQAISAIVRSYDLAESLFCQLEQANDIFRLGFMGAHDNSIDTAVEPQEQSPRVPPLNVRKRTLFFLRALITSDTTSIQRIQQFQSHIVYVIDHILLPLNESDTTTQSNTSKNTNVDDEIIEMALGMIQQLLEQRISVNAILTRKHPLAATAVQRISILRKQQGSPNDNVAVELELWERLLSLLADAKPDPPKPPVNE